jgi:hypothetical protein
MRRRRLILVGIAAAALIAAPAAWYYGSPWWTLWRMREAAQAGDLATLLGSVLTMALADSHNARRLVAYAKRKLAEVERSSGDSPADLTGWLAEVPVRWGGLGGYRTKDNDPIVIHHGLDRFDLRDRRASEENGPVLSFRRHGLGWKLEDAQWGQQ